MMRLLQATLKTLAAVGLVSVLASCASLGKPAAEPGREAGVSARGEGGTAAERFRSARQDPNRLRAFFLQMPKAGDLHHHLSGAVYAETLIQLASYQGDCLDPQSQRIAPCPGVPPESSPAQAPVTLETPDCLACTGCSASPGPVPICCLCGDQKGYDDLVNALSMRGLEPGTLAAHDHFFAIFGKLGHSTSDLGAIVAQLRHQAARENLLYIETMLSAHGGDEAIQELIETYPKDAGGRDLCQQLLEWDPRDPGPFLPYEQWPDGFGGAMGEVADALVQNTLQRSDDLLHCGTAEPDAGCQVTVRLLIELHRTRSPSQVCQEGLRAFAAATARREIVGMNIVAAEDAYRSRIDYVAHMNLIGNLGRIFPQAGRALHAGELWEGLVPPDDLRFHITSAVERAHAQRLGHAVAITYEDDSQQLLERLAGKGGPPVAVEINLVSNAQLLGVKGREHPFLLYVAESVPVVLSTDDPGIMRTSLTEQFLRAATDYPHLTYEDFRRFNRNALAFSFADGQGIWNDPGTYKSPVESCRNARGSLDLDRCREWAAREGGGEKARLQLGFEEKLRAFEGR